jgi:hypothetical protein
MLIADDNAAPAQQNGCAGSIAGVPGQRAAVDEVALDASPRRLADGHIRDGGSGP